MSVSITIRKKKSSNVTGIDIVRVAAFGFAIVSWKATADGLSEYVFGSGWQAGIISFAIQALLFVFNLKLPFYYNCIGELAEKREEKRYHFVVKRGTEEQKYRVTLFQKVIVVFYILILCSSSFFSFIYICNKVVYEHQSGYVDDNAILLLNYRTILNETDDYIKEETKAMQILASKLLGDLQEAYSVIFDNDTTISLKTLKEERNAARDKYKAAKEAYKIAKVDVAGLKGIADDYANQRGSTTYHERQDDWQKLYDKALDDWKKAIEDRDNKRVEKENAKNELRAAKDAVANYQKDANSVISEFLLEMLKLKPSIKILKKDINALNNMIVTLGTDDNVIDNYGELVQSTQSIIAVVNDYIDLIGVSKEKKGIAYLSEQVMKSIVVPNPKSDSFHEEYETWKDVWSEKLYGLEEVIQQLPSFSESNSTELSDSVINIELLKKYDRNEMMAAIDALRRNKISDINVIERAVNLLIGKYFFIAWFSLALAFFFDLSSLLAGLFIYGIQKKPKQRNKED